MAAGAQGVNLIIITRALGPSRLPAPARSKRSAHCRKCAPSCSRSTSQSVARLDNKAEHGEQSWRRERVNLRPKVSDVQMKYGRSQLLLLLRRRRPTKANFAPC